MFDFSEIEVMSCIRELISFPSLFHSWNPSLTVSVPQALPPENKMRIKREFQMGLFVEQSIEEGGVNGENKSPFVFVLNNATYNISRFKECLCRHDFIWSSDSPNMYSMQILISLCYTWGKGGLQIRSSLEDFGWPSAVASELLSSSFDVAYSLCAVGINNKPSQSL